MPDLEIEAKILKNYKDGFVCGIDEVGRGCLAGPVIACALVLKDSAKYLFSDINDSKKLSKKKRESLAFELKRHSFFSIGEATVEEIDSINILQATFLAMQRAFNNLTTKCNIVAAIIDGNKAPLLSTKTYTVIKGDSKSLTIAAASIVAKVERDLLMQNLSQQENNKVYLWDVNAGYGTKHHKDALQKYGVSKYHRKTFAPIKDMIFK